MIELDRNEISKLISRCYLVNRIGNPGYEDGLCAAMRNSGEEPCDICKECPLCYTYDEENRKYKELINKPFLICSCGKVFGDSISLFEFDNHVRLYNKSHYLSRTFEHKLSLHINK